MGSKKSGWVCKLDPPGLKKKPGLDLMFSSDDMPLKFVIHPRSKNRKDISNLFTGKRHCNSHHSWGIIERMTAVDVGGWGGRA